MLVFREIGQAQERLLQDAAGLARPYHADRQIGETLGMVSQSVGQSGAGLDFVLYGLENFLEGRIVLLFKKGSQRPHQGKLGLSQRRHLP